MYINDISKLRINNFDIIRFFCAVLVIYSHSYPLYVGDESKEPLMIFSNQELTFGGMAVAVFFILSGFLITMSFDRNKNLKKYIKARFLRIFPGLAFMLVITTFVLGPIFTLYTTKEYYSEPGTYTYFIRNITLISIQYDLPGVFEKNIYPNVVNGSLWTLFYEVLFYLFVPIMYFFKLLTKKNSRNLLISVTLVNLVLQIISVYTIIDLEFIPGIFITTIYLFNYFLAGIVLYTNRDTIYFSKIFFVISLIFMILLIFIGLPKIGLAIFGAYSLFYISFFSKIKFSNFNKFGDLSYGIYIYGFPIQQGVKQIFGNNLTFVNNLLLVSFITIIFSLISWHLIEKRMLIFK